MCLDAKMKLCTTFTFESKQQTNFFNLQKSKQMEAINKLRAMQRWFDMQSEGMNFEFKSLKGMEKAFDYSIEHNLEFIDNGYLFSANITEKERTIHIKAIKKLQSI